MFDQPAAGSDERGRTSAVSSRLASTRLQCAAWSTALAEGAAADSVQAVSYHL